MSLSDEAVRGVVRTTPPWAPSEPVEVKEAEPYLVNFYGHGLDLWLPPYLMRALDQAAEQGNRKAIEIKESVVWR